jgi:hypothetical protein
MLNHPVKEHFAIPIAYDLMHVNNGPPGGVAGESNRVHMRIHYFPLSSPILADGIMT